MKKYIFIFALVSIASAQHPDAGTVAFPFVNMSYDARTVAMGGVSVAMPNDIYGVLSNPASTGYINRMQAMGGYRQVIMDVWGGPLGLSAPISNGIIITPYLISLTTGSFDIVDENNIPTGTRAKSSYTAGGVSAAKIFFVNFSAGATVKGIYHYMAMGAKTYSADGYAVDLGIQYREKNNRVIYGAALRNVGFMRSGYLDEWNEYDLPYGMEAGVSYVPRHIQNLRLAIEANRFKGDYANVEPALEYAVLEKTLFVRGGYTFSSVDFENMIGVFKGERDDSYTKSTANTFSFGIGVVTAMDDVEIKLDAAILFNSGTGGPSVVLSLLTAF